MLSLSGNSHPIPPNWKSCGASAVSGPEVPVAILQKKIEMAENEMEAELAKEQLESLLDNRKFMEGVVEGVINSVTAGDDIFTSTVFTDNVELTK